MNPLLGNAYRLGKRAVVVTLNLLYHFSQAMLRNLLFNFVHPILTSDK